MEKAMTYYELGVKNICHCNLFDAKASFLEAATRFSQLAKTKKASCDLNKLNAAICYFLAEDSRSAVASLETIRPKNLKKQQVETLKALYEEAKKRLNKTYWTDIMLVYKEMCQKGMHKDIIDLLKYHPYILTDKHKAEQLQKSTAALGMVELSKAFQNDYERLSLKGG